jgi:hypothetical protein
MEGIVSIPEINAIPFMNDKTVSEALANRHADMSFWYTDGTLPAEGYDPTVYCNDVLRLGDMITASSSFANRFKHTSWSNLILRTKTGYSDGTPYYDSYSKFIESFTNNVLPELPDIKSAFPLMANDLVLTWDSDGRNLTISDTNAILLVKKIYTELIISRGLDLIIHNEPWKMLIDVNFDSSFISANHNFAEEVFNAYYPYKNTLLLCKAIKSNVALTGEWSPINFMTLLDENYTKFIRNKLTYILVNDWALKNYYVSKPELSATSFESQVGIVALYVINMLDTLRDYIVRMSLACKKSMKVS